MSNAEIFWLIVAILVTIFCNIFLYLCNYGTKNVSWKYYDIKYGWIAGLGALIDIVLVCLFVTQIEHFNNWLNTL